MLFAVSFLFFLVIFLAMAVGYLFQRKKLQGSCGGISALGIEKACDCPEPCDARKTRLAREEARQKKLTEHRLL